MRIFKVYAIGLKRAPLLPICESCYKTMIENSWGIIIKRRYYHFSLKCMKFWGKPGGGIGGYRA